MINYLEPMFSVMEKERDALHYLHSPRSYRDPGGRLRACPVFPASEADHLPPDELGRLGGEMARRMLDAALEYLTERSVAEMKKSFYGTAFAREPSGTDTRGGPKA